MRALQAVALVTFAHWTRAVGWRTDEVDGLREHLWSWMTIDADRFTDWHAYDSGLLAVALGGDVPPEVRGHWQELGLNPQQAVEMLQGVVEVTHGSLFAVADLDGAHTALQRVLHVADAADTFVPAAEPFCASLVSGADPWGTPTGADVAKWRALEQK